MADLKISQLTNATTPLAGTEVLPIVQSGSTVKVTVNNLTSGKTVTSSGLNVDTTTPFSYNTTSGAGVRIGTQGASGGSMMVQTASLNSSFGSGLAIDGSYATTVSTVNIKAFGVYSGGPYYANLALWTSSGTTLIQQATINGSTGNMTLATGNLVIGTSGKGIDFSATPGTGTSELLADYEEGTFTPNQGTGLTVVGAFVSEGRYTKVGRLVTIHGYLAGATSIAVSAVGQLFSNAPFTTGITCSGSLAGYAGVGNSTCVITNGSTNVVCNTAIGSSVALFFNVTYSV